MSKMKSTPFLAGPAQKGSKRGPKMGSKMRGLEPLLEGYMGRNHIDRLEINEVL